MSSFCGIVFREVSLNTLSLRTVVNPELPVENFTEIIELPCLFQFLGGDEPCLGETYSHGDHWCRKAYQQRIIDYSW